MGDKKIFDFIYNKVYNFNRKLERRRKNWKEKISLQKGLQSMCFYTAYL